MPKTKKKSSLQVMTFIKRTLSHPHRDYYLIAILSFCAASLAALFVLTKPFSLSLFVGKPEAATIPESEKISPTPVPESPKAVNPAAEPYLTATAAFVLVPTSNTTLLSKNQHLRLPLASTTKIMTALVAAEVYQPNEVVTVKDADRSIGQTANLSAGETMTVENLIRAMLINSGNDAAVALAQHHPKGYAFFVELMNQKAQMLGLANTHYTNVSGIQQADHYSSVVDLTNLAWVAVNHPQIGPIVATKETTVSDTTGKISHPLKNLNELLWTVEGVKGVKTGWTYSAGECLVTYVERDYPLITVVLGSRDRFGESKTLIEWAYSNYKMVK